MLVSGSVSTPGKRDSLMVSPIHYQPTQSQQGDKQLWWNWVAWWLVCVFIDTAGDQWIIIISIWCSISYEHSTTMYYTCLIHATCFFSMFDKHSTVDVRQTICPNMMLYLSSSKIRSMFVVRSDEFTAFSGAKASFIFEKVGKKDVFLCS